MTMDQINDKLIEALYEKIAVLEKRNAYLEGRVDAIDAHEDRIEEALFSAQDQLKQMRLEHEEIIQLIIKENKENR